MTHTTTREGGREGGREGRKSRTHMTSAENQLQGMPPRLLVRCGIGNSKAHGPIENSGDSFHGCGARLRKRGEEGRERRKRREGEREGGRGGERGRRVEIRRRVEIMSGSACH